MANDITKSFYLHRPQTFVFEAEAMAPGDVRYTDPPVRMCTGKHGLRKDSDTVIRAGLTSKVHSTIQVDARTVDPATQLWRTTISIANVNVENLSQSDSIPGWVSFWHLPESDMPELPEPNPVDNTMGIAMQCLGEIRQENQNTSTRFIWAPPGKLIDGNTTGWEDTPQGRIGYDEVRGNFYIDLYANEEVWCFVRIGEIGFLNCQVRGGDNYGTGIYDRDFMLKKEHMLKYGTHNLTIPTLDPTRVAAKGYAEVVLSDWIWTQDSYQNSYGQTMRRVCDGSAFMVGLSNSNLLTIPPTPGGYLIGQGHQVSAQDIQWHVGFDPNIPIRYEIKSLPEGEKNITKTFTAEYTSRVYSHDVYSTPVPGESYDRSGVENWGTSSIAVTLQLMETLFIFSYALPAGIGMEYHSHYVKNVLKYYKNDSNGDPIYRYYNPPDGEGGFLHWAYIGQAIHDFYSVSLAGNVHRQYADISYVMRLYFPMEAVPTSGGWDVQPVPA